MKSEDEDIVCSVVFTVLTCEHIHVLMLGVKNEDEDIKWPPGLPVS